MKNKFLSILVVITIGFSFNSYSQTRWNINDTDGSITWTVNKNNIPHSDHIEMSGEYVSSILRYGVDKDGAFSMERSMVWPMLRTIPNNTNASLMQKIGLDIASIIMVNGLPIRDEKVSSLTLKGMLIVKSIFSTKYADREQAEQKIELTRTIFPSVDKPMLCERYSVKNITNDPIVVSVPELKSVIVSDQSRGVDGSYYMSISTLMSGAQRIDKGQTATFDVVVQARRADNQDLAPNLADEKQMREAFVSQMWNNLVLETPSDEINKMFAFAKIRGAESIYRTKGGLMHGPGGESYYAAIWANDQAEYINPFFPFLGYKTGNESVFNSFKHFARFMNPEFRPIPSSIISEGIDVWNGAGDRGDQAMIAYGASRYLLVKADRQEAEQLWPLIEWCLEYLKRKTNDKGVVWSNSDELEGRFPAGDANLCTSSLYYDALLSAAFLGSEIGKPKAQLDKYKATAATLKIAINKHFGHIVEGFDTYRYYDGNEVLRSWICMPLTVGIFDKSKGTIDALLSEKLKTKDGLLTQAGSQTFWDRSTLYALRGIYAAGETEKATEFMEYYSTQRLLGDHVPYAIEAWPEGNQRHLSAESGLYCRIITEGLFGIRPTGFKSFTLTVQLPEKWDKMALGHVKGFDDNFDIEVVREKSGNLIKIKRGSEVIYKKVVNNGQMIHIKL